MSRRSAQQVHDEDHVTPVANCRRCETEAELDRNAEQANAEIVEKALADGVPDVSGGPVSAGQLMVVGELGPETPPIHMVVGEPPARRGSCSEPGCTEPGTHHGKCCAHWAPPGRRA